MAFFLGSKGDRLAHHAHPHAHTRAVTRTLHPLQAMATTPPSASGPIITQLRFVPRSLSHHHLSACLLPNASTRHRLLPFLPPSPVPRHRRATTTKAPLSDAPPPRRAWVPADMSHHLGRVVSDLSHSNSRGARGQGLHHRQSTATSNTDGGGGNVGKAKHKLALLFSGVAAWTRSESSSAAPETGSGGRAKNSRKQQQTTRDGTTTGARRRGLDIAVAVRKYVSMVEQLFASYSGGGGSSNRSSRDGDGRRRRAHTFTYGRGGSSGGSAASSKRHKGRLSSAPASLRGSPANSGHLSVGDSVTKTSTPSEVSTMEELHSAIQAAIAHCKNSAIATSQSAAGGDKQQQRKC